jgi:hypothetical protein
MIQLKNLIESSVFETPESENPEMMEHENVPLEPVDSPTGPQSLPSQPTAQPSFEPHTQKKLTSEEKKKLLGLVSKFNEYRNAMKMADEFKQVAENIVYIAEATEKYGLNEASEWFEGVSLERDMKELKKNAADLQKISNKIHPQIKLAESLYESVGFALSRYFEL